MSNILKIIADGSSSYGYEKVIEFFGFEGLQIPIEKKALLAQGANHTLMSNMVKSYIDYYKMFLLPEEPNAFCANDAYHHIIEMEKTFDTIFTICKYTIEWRKKYFGIDKRVYTFTPWSPKFIYPNQEKTIPVYFTAHMRPSSLLDTIYRVVPKFGGKIVDAAKFGVITHDEKMIINGQSKISITYGLLFLLQQHINSVKMIPYWDKCEAFSYIDTGLMPQMKTRVYEAALSKSIILHKRDMWNVIEDWYTPDVDFIYFDTEDDLEDKINEINKNYDKYKHIAESAYNKTINNYMTEHFIQRYIIPNTKII